ncbi:MAG TPA: 6-phosphofructokinase [Candidatus Fournierella excrementavium]|mgnify:FL=1|uniref:6-phosphofructokinase n=1 Tax=Allofournierella TaxID=1940255 RepID=UPI0015AA4088|nr:6-phosphofructokinase [Fournierella sp.]MCI6958649.1 6-phosphofructokinase [Oscillospiraceae bacterium]MEE0756759.1 6-phosphofructokinase [Fournierella sp.]HJD17942.1 6-phosphofructokinase [Candidatus Fournierella excrementavium]
MAKEVKTIGVLTSGGDAPGMNAAVRAVVRTALGHGMRVIGIQRGFNGLLNGETYEMNLRSVSEIIHRGGTVLYTARCLEFKTEEGQRKGAEMCEKLGIDALVVIGGDGSFRGAKALANLGIPCIGIPGTIDNDIACSEYTIGYDTAMNTAVEMVDKLRDTTQSHDRCSVVEVMGRNAGYIALNVGIATGAIATLIPERPYDLERDILERMQFTQKTGKKHFIVIVAEGAGHAQDLANEIQARTGIDSRATVLGHVQRGGSPTLRDRVTASRMGYQAVILLEKGIFNRVVAVSADKIVDYDINVALSMHKSIDTTLLDVAETISI